MTTAEYPSEPTLHLELALSRIDGLSTKEALEVRRNDLLTAISLITWEAQQKSRGVVGAAQRYNDAFDFLITVNAALTEAELADTPELDVSHDYSRPLRLISTKAVDGVVVPNTNKTLDIHDE